MSSRFANVSEAEIDILVGNKDAKCTQKATEQSWRVFTTYCKEKAITLNLETITKCELNNILKKFYVEARKSNGEFYRKTSLTCLRHGINRKIKETFIDWDIVNDSEFESSRIVYTAQCTDLKRKGLAKVEHYPPISKEDLAKLYSSKVFDVNSPKNLQWKVFFELMLFLCRRGQENLRDLTKTSFRVKTGANGSKYIEKVVDELTKNHRENDEIEDGGIITERSDELCPVKSFEKYISKLNPKVDYLFQRPKKEAPNDDGPWYDAQVVGVNSLEKIMKNISVEAKLSQNYTNHSIRATTITILDGEGYEARHILTVSGHRSANSLRSYCRTNLTTKRKMSEALSSSSSEMIPGCSGNAAVENKDSGSGNTGVTIENLMKKCKMPESLSRNYGKIDRTDPRLSSRNFDFGMEIFDDSNETAVNQEDNTHDIDFSENSVPSRLPFVIRNNSSCVFNIKL